MPAFGIYSEIVATFSAKRLFGYESLVYATAAIAILSFTVWLHHFFTMGSSANVNAFFGIATMIIAVPTGVKVFDWLLTMYRGRIYFHPSMLWTLGFIVTFVIGGMTGVMLALPPADYLMHNTTFLVAHFHNMLIPGALFGYFAGYMYWFPKAFGFTLNERWGVRSFWCWLIGFYLAFMPLYALGFMGMPRRMEHYNVAEWQPYLIVAAAGASLVLLGIVFLVVQLVVSIRQRQQALDLSGDPWNGRTLEWLTSSPPAPYNFAVPPQVRDIDAFRDMKERGAAYRKPDRYEDIYLPKNTGAGAILGGLAFLIGFGMVWHIWWVVIACALGMWAVIIARACDDDAEYCLPASEVEKIEDRRYQAMASAARSQTANNPYFSSRAAGQPAMIADAWAATSGRGDHEQELPDVYEQRAFGFWLYLMSDAIIFSLLFATYVVMALNNAGGPTGKSLFSLSNAFGETMLLLVSSLTFGFATLAMKSDKRAGVLAWLLVTFVLGLGFVGLEIREFYGLVQVGAGPDRSGFLSAFFTLVGTHGLHVSFGLIWIIDHGEPGHCQRSDRTGDLPFVSPGPVLAFPGHCLGRHLLSRVSSRDPVNGTLNPP